MAHGTCLDILWSNTAAEDANLWDLQVKSCWNSSAGVAWSGYSNLIGPISDWLEVEQTDIMKWSDRHI